MTFAETDPEFAQYHADFVDETLQHASLNSHDRAVVQLGAMIAAGAQTAFRQLLGTALDESLTPVEAKEIGYQAVAYVGSARASDFLRITNDVLIARGVELPLPGRSTTTPGDRLERGRAVQSAVVGAGRVDAMYENAADDTVHFQRFLSGNCFGDTVGRDGLDLPTRELLTFAVLVALGGADAQVTGHVAGNLHVGNTRQQLLDVLTVLVPVIGYPRTLNGLAAVNEGAPAD
ncbi:MULTISPECIES: carboxymuconolactone decarboxylase family protein [unclassified Curtobacterium]|uniref:carboxymuconolactone decarboxylase family protein n=1 Tax=unclassified Curtobacterium TaxID=257496 RepID=UPI000F47A61D|nr:MULTISPECIES: carboxymuconolactone decarboxylase family protein [unclassified Curtobacterium]ROQ16475.1 4-carboxymuconolactone decarboxylase [Curtobacterium sp. PhB171]ROQ25449.1 4-carboxymuconolactone decarboxylase [Curtobacterium sp. PhB170]ROS36901.1 4-carboxymuconolactone decarboxylase [Curtobacterium sp. PhB131]ROS71577.1 4-carboxymuconolactone decarboxylase [Curtobacterium sp. PhB141]